MRERQQDRADGEQWRRIGELREPSLGQLALTAWLIVTVLVAVALGLAGS